MASDLTLYDSSGNPVIMTGDELAEFIGYPPPIGHNQTWQDVTSARAVNTEYTNDTGRAIAVSAFLTTGADLTSTITLEVDNLAVAPSVGTGYRTFHSVIVSAGSTYQMRDTAGVLDILHYWVELREGA